MATKKHALKKVRRSSATTVNSRHANVPEKKETPPAPRVMQVVEVEETPDEQKSTETLILQEEKSHIQPEELKQTEVPQDEAVSAVALPEKPQNVIVPDMNATDEGVQSEAEKGAEQKEEGQKELISTLFKKDPSVGLPEIQVHTKPLIPPIVVWMFFVLVIVGLIGGGLVLVSKGSVTLHMIEPAPTATPTLSPTATPTPTPAINRSELKIQVLNGSGVKGAATDMKTVLEQKGYKVANTGNAKKYDYKTTEISLKEKMATFGAILQDDIAPIYAVGSVSATLDPKATYDAVIIVGKEKTGSE